MPRAAGLPLLLLAGLAALSCGSPDVAEAGDAPPTLVCTKVYIGSGFSLEFLLAASRWPGLDGATVSVCRVGDPCHAMTIELTPGKDRWSRDDLDRGFFCYAGVEEEMLTVFARVDTNYDSSVAPLADGDVWQGRLTDSQGQVILSFAGPVDYLAICRNGSPRCGVAHVADACVSDGVVDCQQREWEYLCGPTVVGK